jgi:hypothetical protein
MFCKRRLIVSYCAIVGLSVFTSVQIVEADPSDTVCVGQYRYVSECNAKGGETHILGVPTESTDCSTTCESRLYKTYFPCGVNINDYAVSFCSPRHAVVTTIAIHGGNHCGYGWFTIDCQ